VGAIKVALRLGDERFDHYIRAFGFGQQTGIELPGETRGLAKPVSRWSKISIGAISMGQEIGVSALQLVSMISTIANDGVYNAPRVVAGTIVSPDPRLKTVVFHPAEQHRIISTLTAAEMKKMLEGVVLFGTGKKALLDGYTSAGKTGTAQKIDSATGRYSRSNYIASFAGFAPVNNPAATIVVILDSPRGSHEGGQVAAPVFARIAQQLLTYLNVRHDAEISDKRRMLLRAAADAPATDVTDSPETIEEEPQLAVMQPPKETPAQPLAEIKTAAFKKAATAAPPAAKIGQAQIAPAQSGMVVVDIGDRVSVPSFVGLPMREALERAEEAGLELDIAGSGTAREQAPLPGARIPPGGHVAVTFAH
jgi:cell division protein FtsI (penicillin-binding protein 3)